MLIAAPIDNFSPKSYRISTAETTSDISVLEIGYNRVPRGLKQIQKRNVYILHYVVDGKGVFSGTEFDKSCGYLVVPDELEIIKADETSPYETYWIMFQGYAAEDLLKKCGLVTHNGVFKFNKNEQCAEILRKALYEITPANEFEELYIMQSVFYRIIALHMSQQKLAAPDSSVTQRVKNFIVNNYHQQICIEDLAKENFYTRNYLYTIFKKEYGISPKEYLLNLRIKKAKMLLKDKTEKLTVREVAFAVGFNDSLYFSRLFRKRTGLSPTEFRNNCLAP